MALESNVEGCLRRGSLGSGWSRNVQAYKQMQRVAAGGGDEAQGPASTTNTNILP